MTMDREAFSFVRKKRPSLQKREMVAHEQTIWIGEQRPKELLLMGFYQRVKRPHIPLELSTLSAH